MVCDMEVEGFKLVLDSLLVTPFLLLSGPSASIVVVRNVPACVSMRTANLKAVVHLHKDWAAATVELCFGCVKAHIGIV